MPRLHGRPVKPPRRVPPPPQRTVSSISNHPFPLPRRRPLQRGYPDLPAPHQGLPETVGSRPGGAAGPQTHETMRDSPPRDAASQSACSRRGHQRCPFPQHARRKSTVPDGFCLSCLQKSRGTLPAAAFKKPPSPVKRENRKPRRGIPVWAFGL